MYICKHIQFCPNNSLNDHHLNIFLLNIEEKDEQLMMTVGENEFVKE